MTFPNPEVQCLKAGLGQSGEKDALWFNPMYRTTIERLMDLGLIVAGGRPNAHGQVVKIPLSLTRYGFQIARELAEAQP